MTLATAATPSVLLGSTSHYRAELLHRLLPQFEQCAPGTDETPLSGEAPADRALRLAITKACAAADGRQNTLVIGSDQVAELHKLILDKPGTAERACAQLRASSGQVVQFHTGLCLLDTRDGRQHTHLDHTLVHFRTLTDTEIQRYIEREQPLDCAGSFKVEGLGISLFERIESEDPSALIGLPLIALAHLLRMCGVPLP